MNIFFINQIGTLNYLNIYFQNKKKNKNNFKVYFSLKLKKILKKKNLSFKYYFIKNNYTLINKILSQLDIDKIILSSSGNSILEKNIILLAKKKKIKAISIIDTWDNLKNRFIYKTRYYLPDTILCIDNYSKKKLEKIFKNLEIRVIGQPYLEKILKN